MSDWKEENKIRADGHAYIEIEEGNRKKRKFEHRGNELNVIFLMSTEDIKDDAQI